MQTSVDEVLELVRQASFRRERLANSERLMKGASKLEAKERETFAASATKLRDDVRR